MAKRHTSYSAQFKAQVALESLRGDKSQAASFAGSMTPVDSKALGWLER